MRVGQKNKLTYRWARKGSRPRAIHDQRTQSTYLFGAVCPERSRRCPRAARLQHRGHAAPSRRNRNESHPRRTRRSHSRSSWMARRQRPQGSQKHLAPAAAAACAGAQPPRKYLAIHAGELAVEPHLQILRRNRRSLLLRLEYAHRSTLENHVHRSPRLGSRRSLIVRVGISQIRRDVTGTIIAEQAWLLDDPRLVTA